MRIDCINSNSDGNCFILTDDNGKMLLLDAGVSIKRIKIGVNFNTTDIVGAVISHTHLDHSKAVKDLKSLGVQVFTPYTRKDDAQRVKTSCGDYEIIAFANLKSDGTPAHTNADGTPCKCYGFYITHRLNPDFNLVYVTDTMYCSFKFNDLKNIIFGTNYQIDKLEKVNETRIYHTLTGHASIDVAVGMLRANKPQNTVILSHLSLDNADAELFKARASEVVDCPVYIAQSGMNIEL